MVLAQLCAGELQRFVQFVQHFQRVIQPQQSAIPQAVVALFLVERLEQSFQLAHREFAGVHLQIKHTACTDTPTEIFGGAACKSRNASLR